MTRRIPDRLKYRLLDYRYTDFRTGVVCWSLLVKQREDQLVVIRSLTLEPEPEADARNDQRLLLMRFQRAHVGLSRRCRLLQLQSQVPRGVLKYVFETGENECGEEMCLRRVLRYLEWWHSKHISTAGRAWTI